MHALDDPAEWDGFGRPVEGAVPGRWESYLAIQGMYCPACSLAVEEALMQAPGVQGVQVSGATSTARIVWEPSGGLPSGWLAALHGAGYGGVPAGDALNGEARVHEQRMLLWRWLAAGFCMMQVMMYTFPAYVAQPGDITPDIAALLRWASWILTLPVLAFSSRPFFDSALRDIRARTIGMDVPVALGIVIAFAASTAATFDPQGPLGGETWFDSVTMFVFFLLSGRLLQQRMAAKTAGALQALGRSLPDTVERDCGGGRFETIPVRRLRVGDVVRVRPGEVLPADGIVTAGESRVDEALLTGESTPLRRRTGDHVVAGSHNLSGVLSLRVERAGAQTRFAEIAALMERAAFDKPAIAQLADRAARPFLAAVLVSAAGAAWWWWPAGPAHAIGVAVAVLIVTCPCALSLATPAATLCAAGALARRGVLVRRLDALEHGASIDTVAFDKTGTLTQDRMSLASVHTRPELAAAQALALATALARESLHPASRAIVVAAEDGMAEGRLRAERVEEVAGRGLAGDVHDGNAARHLRLGSAEFCGLVRTDGARVHLADQTGWLATFLLDETLRPGAVAQVRALESMGLEVLLLSGDKPDAVARLARRVGIRQARGGQKPQDKLAHVEHLQQVGRRVAMVGDGINDGPVLARADLSIAMGQGVPVAQARADVLIQGSELDRVPLLLAQARRTRGVVRQNLLWAAGYNAVCVPLAVMGLLPPWLAGLGMAASSLFVVANSARLARLPGMSGGVFKGSATGASTSSFPGSSTGIATSTSSGTPAQAAVQGMEAMPPIPAARG